MRVPSTIVIGLRRAAKGSAPLLASAALLISAVHMQAHAAPPGNQAGCCAAGPSAVAADKAAPAISGARLGIVMSGDNPLDGVKLLQVYAGGPADKMGLQPGDLITTVDSKSVSNPGELQAIVFKHLPGDSLSLSVTRSGWQRTFIVTAVSQADLARLPDPQAVEKAPTRALSRAAPAIRPSYFTIEEPSEWEKIRDPYLRARYTRFR